jgi:hypothetical protein
MFRHVLAIFEATPAGEGALREASFIAAEHDAQLTVAVITGTRRLAYCDPVAAAKVRWRLRERSHGRFIMRSIARPPPCRK